MSWRCEPCDVRFASNDGLKAHGHDAHRASSGARSETGRRCRGGTGICANKEVGRVGRVESWPTKGPVHLALVLRALGVSRMELSDRTGIPVQAIALFEDARVDLPDADKAAIARVLEVPKAVLWGPSTDVLLAWLERPSAAAAVR